MEIAIISKNKSFSRFFEIEALSFGAKASTFEKTSANISDFSLIIIDVDTVKNIASIDIDKLLAVSCDETLLEGLKNVRSLAWPVSVEALRKVFENVKYAKVGAEIINDADENVIYFYKNAKNTVRYGNRRIALSEYEAKLLELLCKNAYETVCRGELNSLLGAEQGNMTDVYICKLRKKLEERFGKRLIFTVRSKGYRIMAKMEWE